MMKSLIIVFLQIVCVSCSIDYIPNLISEKDQNKLIVNCLLSPQNKIQVQFYTTFQENNNYAYKAIKNISILLLENDSILFSGISSDSILNLNYYPKAGKLYSIKASANGLKEISAFTKIPSQLKCNGKYIAKYGVVNIYDFNYENDNFAAWFTANYLKNDTLDNSFTEYITNNLFVDIVNQSNDTYYGNEVLGSLYCDGFIRIKASNIIHLDSLKFADMRPLLNSPYQKLTGIRVNIISASNEYDQFNKSIFQQISIPTESDINAMFYQPVRVYCNIKNGLGIFAGLNQSYLYVYK